MRKLVVLACAGLAAVFAGSAAAVPNGNGLVVAPEEITCEGLGPVEVLVTRGDGATAWVLDTGPHVVLKKFSVTGTFTPEGGDPVPESFSKSFGQKKGLGTPIVCTFPILDVVPGEGTFEGTATVEVLPVPKR